MKPEKIKYAPLPATIVEGFDYKWEWHFLRTDFSLTGVKQNV